MTGSTANTGNHTVRVLKTCLINISKDDIWLPEGLLSKVHTLLSDVSQKESRQVQQEYLAFRALRKGWATLVSK